MPIVCKPLLGFSREAVNQSHGTCAACIVNAQGTGITSGLLGMMHEELHSTAPPFLPCALAAEGLLTSLGKTGTWQTLGKIRPGLMRTVKLLLNF